MFIIFKVINEEPGVFVHINCLNTWEVETGESEV